MKQVACILAAIVVSVFPAALEAGRANKKQPADPPAAIVSRGLFGDDIDRIDAVCELTDAQKTRLRAAKTGYDKAVEKYDKDTAAKLTKIEEYLGKLSTDKKDSKAADTRKQLEAMKARIAAGRENLAEVHTRKMFGILTAAQKVKWNLPPLTEEVVKEFSAVMLTPAQNERIESFCAQQVKSLALPIDPLGSGYKQLNPLKLKVYNTILTPAQQAEYRKLKAPAPPKEKKAKGAKAK